MRVLALPAAADVITEEELEQACDESADDESSQYCYSGEGPTEIEEIPTIEEVE